MKAKIRLEPSALRWSDSPETRTALRNMVDGGETNIALKITTIRQWEDGKVISSRKEYSAN